MEENPDSALIEVRRKMKLEQDNIRKFKFRMKQRDSDLLHELSE